MAYGYTRTLPTVVGSHSNFPILLVAGSFPVAAIDGGVLSILNGGGNLRAYTDDTKVTQLPVDVDVFVTGVTPSIQVWIKTTAVTSGTIYLEADEVATVQPIATDSYGRNAVWSDYEFVSHNLSEDATGNHIAGFTVNGSPTQVDSPWGAVNGGYSFNGSNQWVDANPAINPMAGLVEDSDITMQAYMSSSSTDTYNRAVHVRGSGAGGIMLMQNHTVPNTFGMTASVGFNSSMGIVYSSTTDSSILTQVSITNTLNTGSINAVDTEIYFDGVSKATTFALPGLGNGTSGNFIRIGARSDGTGGYFGTISEVRFRKSKLSADWIATESSNQGDPATWGTSSVWSGDTTPVTFKQHWITNYSGVI